MSTSYARRAEEMKRNFAAGAFFAKCPEPSADVLGEQFPFFHRCETTPVGISVQRWKMKNHFPPSRAYVGTNF
jgi:hypothetical protein